MIKLIGVGSGSGFGNRKEKVKCRRKIIEKRKLNAEER